MRKIRKFKITLHYKEILRRLRGAGIDLRAAGFQDESELAVFLTSLHAALEPGVVYEFLEGQNLELTGIGLDYKMSSLCALTLGEKIDQEIAKIINPQALAIASIALMEFLRTAVMFMADVVSDDAKKEEFETENYTIIAVPQFNYSNQPKFIREAKQIEVFKAKELLPVLLDRLNSTKVGITYQEGQLLPKNTIVFVIPWKKKKGKK
jgi:hypothetical protein